MTLTKQDLEGIEKILDAKIDNLALMINKGFEQTNERIAKVEERIAKIDLRLAKVEMELSHMNARLSVIESDIADIKKHFVYRNEFEDLMARVKYLETKLGVESGK